MTRLKEQYNWKPIALEKFPYQLFELLHDQNLAFPLNSYIHEQNPVLIEPIIADLILGRLARNVAAKEELSAVAPLKRQVEAFLLSKKMPDSQKRSRLIATTIDVDIPRNLEFLPFKEFLQIRKEFALTRQKINSLSQTLLVDLDLDKDLSVDKFEQLIRDRYSDVSNQISTANAQLKMEKNIKFCIDLISSVTGQLASSLSNDLSGSIGGTIVSPVLSRLGLKVTNRFTTLAMPNDFQKQIGAIRSRIMKKAPNYSYHQSSYRL